MQNTETPAHVLLNDNEIVQADIRNRCIILLGAQPLISTDFHILVLGFVRAVQSLQYESVARNLEELVNPAQGAFLTFDPRKLDKTFFDGAKLLRVLLEGPRKEQLKASPPEQTAQYEPCSISEECSG